MVEKAEESGLTLAETIERIAAELNGRGYRVKFVVKRQVDWMPASVVAHTVGMQVICIYYEGPEEGWWARHNTPTIKHAPCTVVPVPSGTPLAIVQQALRLLDLPPDCPFW